MNEKDQITVLIIEDEEPARSLIRHYLNKYEELVIVGECPDGYCGLLSIRELDPDLVFLDIQMPKLSGFELLEITEKKPEIIFTTAFDEYAIKAFDMNAVDYLLKPFSKQRFDAALVKAIDRIRRGGDMKNDISRLREEKPGGYGALNRIVIRKGTGVSFIQVKDVHYMQAEDDYVMIYHAGGKDLKQQRLKYYEKHLPENEFARIHRSYLARIERIERIEPYGRDTYIAIMKDGKRLPVSRSGYKKLML